MVFYGYICIIVCSLLSHINYLIKNVFKVGYV